MNIKELWYKYEEWLMNRVGFDWEYHHRLMDHLHNCDFNWIINMDENRAMDGVWQRQWFFEEYPEYGDYELDFDKYDCSVLEMLVAFAIRMESEVGGLRESLVTEHFTEFLVNLGLLKFSDRRFRPGPVNDILDVWLLRRFDKNGKGSLFPLKVNKSHTDQRKIEIWRQMWCYFSEKGDRK